MASHKLIIKMLQTSQITSCIRKQRCIHKHPILRSLRNICSYASLRKQFADIPISKIIPVYLESRGQTDIGFVNLAILVQSPASARELGSMIRTNLIKKDKIFFTQARERMKELSIGNFVDFPSKRFAQTDNLMSNLPGIIFDKIPFFMPQSFERFESSLASQISKTFNRNSKIVSINIYTNNIPAFRRLFILFDKNLNSEIFEQKNGADLPSFNQIFSKSLISTILDNRQGNSFMLGITRNIDNHSFLVCFVYSKEFGIKPDRDAFNLITDLSSVPNKSPCRDKQISRKIIFSSEVFIGETMQNSLSYAFIFLPATKNLSRTGKIFRIQFKEFNLESSVFFLILKSTRSIAIPLPIKIRVPLR